MSLNKNIAHTFLTQFPVAILSIFSGILLTRLLGPDGKGIFTLFQVNINFLILFLSFSLSSGLVYFVAQNKIKTEQIIGLSILTLFIGTLTSVILLTLISSLNQSIFFPKGFNNSFYLWYIIISFSANFINSIIAGIFIGKSNFKLVNKISILFGIIDLSIWATTYWILKYHIQNFEIEILFLISAISLVMKTLAWIYLYLVKISILPTFNISYHNIIKPFIKYVGLSHLSNVIHFFNYRLDIWFIEAFRSTEQLGYYSLSVNIVQMLWMISTPLAQVLRPHFSEENQKNLEQKMLSYSRINFSIVLVASLILYFLSDILIPFLYGQAFIPSIFIVKVLLPGILLSCFTKPFSAFIAGKNKVHYNLLAVSIGLVLTIILNIILVPTWGILGAAISTTISYSTIALIVFIFYIFKFNYKFKNYFFLSIKDLRGIKLLINK